MPTKREVKESLEFLGVLSGQLAPEDCRTLGKPTAKRRQHEAGEQAALFSWAKLSEGKYPALRLMFHIPNGGSRKSEIEGANLKKQGVRAGVPDICLPVPSGQYHGLFIELKAQGGRVQQSQREWIDALKAQGYLASVCYGFSEARDEIENYLQP